MTDPLQPEPVPPAPAPETQAPTAVPAPTTRITSSPTALLIRWAIILAGAFAVAAVVVGGWRPVISPQGYAFGALAILYLATVVVLRSASPLALAVGEDGRVSSSKFQFLIWTAVAIYSYVLLWATRALLNTSPDHLAALESIPKNLLIAMGFSITTSVGAKAITVSMVRTGQVTKTQRSTADGPAAAGLVAQDDLQTPDLTKVQMLVWTVIAAVVYLVRLNASRGQFATCALTGPTPCEFPDIDQAFMVLMGLAHGAYLGGKLTSRDTAPDPAAGAGG